MRGKLALEPLDDLLRDLALRADVAGAADKNPKVDHAQVDVPGSCRKVSLLPTGQSMKKRAGGLLALGAVELVGLGKTWHNAKMKVVTPKLAAVCLITFVAAIAAQAAEKYDDGMEILHFFGNFRIQYKGS